jgi:hypothetical protein
MNKLLHTFLFLCLTAALSAQTLRVKPLVSTDDAEQNLVTGAMYLNSTDLELGGFDWDAMYRQSVGIRFPNVALPQGATINKAYIQFSVDEIHPEGANTSIITIKAQKGNAATYVATAKDLSNRTYTTASATWNTAAWTALDQRLVAQQTPDLKPIIVEAIQSGWVSGNALAFYFTTGVLGRTTAWAADRANGGVQAPELVIEYTKPVVPTICMGKQAKWCIF